MAETKAPHRQTITLTEGTARRVKALARARRVSASRVLADLVEVGLDAEQRRREEFLQLARKFRAAEDTAEAERLGDQLGRLLFGG